VTAAIEPTPDQPLAGRVAVITGGSRGMGLAMAEAYAAAGADVVIASRKLDVCEQAAEKITAATGRRAVPVACHVGRWGDLEALYERAYAEFPRVDVLVNNAGMSPLYPTLGAVTEDLFDKVVGINFKGPFRLCALFGERMKADGRGSIINVSSTASLRPTPRELPYSGAKAALNAITVGFARALGPEVRVNTIVPGPFLTDIAKAWDLDSFAESAKRFPLRRGGQPEEIVGAAMYFATDASSFATGSMLVVDGGTSVPE
jgi:NAD(P)-dependent dehydrogenase (short-subunit alcohol dehydrogenase family)